MFKRKDFIMKVSYKTNSKGLEGKISIRLNKRNHTVNFSQDRKGDYGYFQWGAPKEILGLTVDTVERICTRYLEDSL